MHRIALLVCLAVLPWTGLSVAASEITGTHPVSVAQLSQALASAEGKSDADVQQELAGFELTERLSEARYTRLVAALPGEQSQQQLRILAGRSALLDLPAAEIPANPAPDMAAQRKIMALTVNYVTGTLSQLPNFFATRQTTHYEDRPQQDVQGETGLVSYSFQPLHSVGKSSRQVVYRDGKETADPAAAVTGKQQGSGRGLVSYGEFGPILSTVLLDAAQSKLGWSHWEQGADGLLAVFSYEVPAQKSHYLVQFCCLVNYSEDNPAATFHARAGYRGEMTVDPATGVILRVTVDADLPASDPVSRAGIMVLYGSVEIGGKSYFCPIRSVSLSIVHYAGMARGMQASSIYRGPLKTYLNDTVFQEYHRLGAEMRILAANEPLPPTAAGSQPPVEPAPATEAPAGASPSVAGDEAKPDSPAPSASAPASAPPPAASPAPEPEVAVGAVSNIPDAAAASNAQQQGGFVLKMNSRLVDVGVIVVDKKGRPVRDLKATDFSLYDNGRKQQLKFFSEIAGGSGSESATAPGASADTPPVYSNQPAAVAGPALAAQSNATILLMDESHIAWSDMSHARQQVLQFLKGLAPGERVGLYSLNGLGFRVLTEVTADHDAVIARLNKWMPSAQSVSQAREDETRNRQQFETVHSMSDLNSVNGNQVDAPIDASPIDPQLLTMGSDPGRASLIILREVARHLEALPGHKSLVWISSDNVFVDWQDMAVSVDKNLNSIDSFVLRAQEAMNDAHASVYPFDVSQLEAGSIGADTQNRNVELNPASVPPPIGGAPLVPRDMTAGRTKAAMLQDVRAIQEPIQKLAADTGGRTIRRSSDLAGELGAIVQDGHASYLLSFYPDTPPDDRYHTVKVDLDGRKGLTVRGRTGYLYAREATTPKARFQQAIWLPNDATEIRVSATTEADSGGGTLVKLEMEVPDLVLQQRGGRWMDKLDVFFVQRDDAGVHAQLEGQTLGLRLKPETYQKLMTEGLPYQQVVKRKPGTGTLRVVVLDENSGRMGSVTMPLEGKN